VARSVGSGFVPDFHNPPQGLTALAPPERGMSAFIRRRAAPRQGPVKARKASSIRPGVRWVGKIANASYCLSSDF